jgi:hypothetical protein
MVKEEETTSIMKLHNWERSIWVSKTLSFHSGSLGLAFSKWMLTPGAATIMHLGLCS